MHVAKRSLWLFSYHNDYDIDNHVNALKECGVNPEFIHPFDICPGRPKQLSLF